MTRVLAHNRSVVPNHPKRKLIYIDPKEIDSTLPINTVDRLYQEGYKPRIWSRSDKTMTRTPGGVPKNVKVCAARHNWIKGSYSQET